MGFSLVLASQQHATIIRLLVSGPLRGKCYALVRAVLIPPTPFWPASKVSPIRRGLMGGLAKTSLVQAAGRWARGRDPWPFDRASPNRHRHNAPIRGQIGGSAVAWDGTARHLIGEIISVDAVKAYSLQLRRPAATHWCVPQASRLGLEHLCRA